MIKNIALPDDKSFKKYFLKLKEMRYNNSNFFFVNRFSRELAISQNHICPICNEVLYNGEAIEKHHIIPYKDGGKTNFGNLVLLHLPCHRKITFTNEHEKQETKEFLIKYKKLHPSSLAKFIRQIRKEGQFKDKPIDEIVLSNFEANTLEL